YVTFNYDTLLEASLTRRFGWRFEKLDDYVRDTYVVVKVHGSANWMQATNLTTVEGVGVTRDQLIDLAGSLERRDEFIVAGPGTTQYALNGVVPAIAIPAAPKTGFACPTAHINALTDLLPDVERVLCIGWRGVDRSLLELMAGHLSQGIETTVVTSRPKSPGGEPLDPDIVRCTSDLVPWVGDAGLTGACEVIRAGFSGFVGPHLPDFVASMAD
ncbi:MAG: SIR2 family protein, partial [Actinomycetota bacterium]|nr:SIR2 family protein [Actinomycetota bacterium]